MDAPDSTRGTARPQGELVGASVCLVGINYAPDFTGIAPYSEALAKALHSAGAKVHVITGIPHYPQWRVTDEKYTHGSRWEETSDGVRITRVLHHVPSIPGLVGRIRMELSFLLRSMGAVLADRSDVVIAVTPSLAGLVAAAIGKKRRPLGAVVQDLTGNAASESGTTSGRAAKAIAWAEYLLLRRADLVGVITPQFGAVLRSKKIKAAAIEELPNFTHISAVSVTQATARLHLGWPEHGFSVVHTGNMGMKQGLEAVVDAARLSDERGLGVNFILVGDGNQRPFLEQMAGGIPTLRFVDPVDSKDYPFALAAADALLIHERAGVKEMSLPSKLTSYSAANRPILAVLADGGITQIVVSRERAALVVQPGDPSALLDAAIALRENAELSRKFTDAAKDMFERSHSPIAAKQRYVNFAKRLRQQKQNDAIDARSVGITNQTAN